MTATGQNFTMYQGDTLELEVTVTDPTNNDAVVDLTNCSLTWVLYRQNQAGVILTKTVGSGITITDASNGEFKITLDPSDTLNLYGLYRHESELKDPTNKISTLFIGKADIYKSKANNS